MDLLTRETVTEFADLMCADPQWLRGEFDALIAASFSRPPSTPLAPPTTLTAPRPPTPPAGQGHVHLPTCLTAWFREHVRCRQRSPPR